MKTPTTSQKSPSLEQDSRLFLAFLTLVVGITCVSAVISTPALQQPWRLVIFTLLVLLHITLHWLLAKISAHPAWTSGYIAGQGSLAFAIIWLSGGLALIFALFMGLIGEAIGLFGLTRKGLFALAYYLALSLFLFTWQLGPGAAGGWALVSIPVVIFVVMYVTLYTRQAAAWERARGLLQELEAANKQLSEYAARVEDLTIANERQRMARELHDTLSQGLAGLILQLEAVDANLGRNRPERAREIIQETLERARSTLADARRAIGDLRLVQSEHDLDGALRTEIARFQDATGIPCTSEIQIPPNLENAAAETMLRVIAEALTNIARHAQASTASIKVWSEGGATPSCLCAEIRDNGIGFDPDAVAAGHYGLLGMRERARLVSGALSFESQPGAGTVVTLTLPLSTAGRITNSKEIS